MPSFELVTRSFAKKSKIQALKILHEQGVKTRSCKFVFHQAVKRYSVIAGSKKVAVVQEGLDPYTMAVLEVPDSAAQKVSALSEKKTVTTPPATKVGARRLATDWSKFDKHQIWEIYQGLARGVKVSGYFDPRLSATEMCARRLAAQ